ncbi:MAG: hypothetical protein ABRQ39_21100 [Candidatus Eremiobacterota bacterium]
MGLPCPGTSKICNAEIPNRGQTGKYSNFSEEKVEVFNEIRVIIMIKRFFIEIQMFRNYTSTYFYPL